MYFLFCKNISIQLIKALCCVTLMFRLFSLVIILVSIQFSSLCDHRWAFISKEVWLIKCTLCCYDNPHKFPADKCFFSYSDLVGVGDVQDIHTHMQCVKGCRN